MTEFTPTQAMRSAAVMQKGVANANSEKAAELAKKTLSRLELTSKTQDLASLREADQRDRAVRLLDGPAAAPEKASRSRKISRLDEEIPALMAALPLLDERIAEKEKALAAAHRPYQTALLDVLCELQGPALDKIRATLASLIEL